MRKAPDPLFRSGARCVHPQHGVVEVSGIVQRDVGGVTVSLYELRLVAADGKILIPVAAAAQAGLRSIMTEQEADALLVFLKAKPQQVDARPFQKRMRDYADMLRSGERRAIAHVLRVMHRTSARKDLSFGERKLLTQAETMLLTEIAMAKRISVEDVEHLLEKTFAA